MFRRGVVVLVVSILLGSAMFSGCGDSGNRTIAVVGDYNITLDEFEETTQGMRQTFPKADMEFAKRRQALDSLIVTRMLVQAAYEKGIDQHEEIARVVLANKDKFLLDVLYLRHVVENTDASDAEIRDFYNHLEHKLRAYQIVVDSLETAQMLFDRLKEGADFEQLAYEYSTDPGAKRNRGDIGYFVWGAMVDAFQEAAFAMEPGELSPPVKSRYGYHIIKVVDKTPNELRGSFEETKESVRGQILNRKRAQLTAEYFDYIRAKYPITIDSATCDYLLHKREQLYPPQLLANLPKSDFDLEQLDRNERELVMANWEGGQVTVLEYLSLIRQVPEQYRPDLDDYDSLKTFVFELKKTDLLSYEATLEGVENDPEFKRKLSRFKELAMADMMRNDSIPVPPAPDEAAARLYYDEHHQEFSNPAKIHLFEILLSDELQARKLAGEIKSLEAFKEKAMDLTERPGKRVASGDLDYIERSWFPEIFDRAWKTPTGKIGGPVFAGGKYSIFYVVDRTEAELKDFLGVKREIMQKLLREQVEQVFGEWVEERKAKTEIEINEDLIWETIDMSKYASVDSGAVTSN
ncbi:MAG TPA: peptidylprolyl isomerase [Acidobacteriota bacterium]|nr:peptidylprolyl isomerase [Acidobacteriota bacterium]